MKITEKDPGRHNHIEYPMELGGQKFEPINIEKEKDIMLNVAKLNAQQEYARIMESAAVLKKQADALVRRVELTELIHRAKFNFKPIPGKRYWLYLNRGSKFIPSHYALGPLGPHDWDCSAPPEYDYIAYVACLADQTWQEVDSKE